MRNMLKETPFRQVDLQGRCVHDTYVYDIIQYQ